MRILLSAIYPYIFVILFIILPFDDYIRIWPNILLILLAAIFPIIVRKKDFQRLRNIPFYLFLAFIVYLLLIALLFNRFETDFHTVGKILLTFGLVVLYIPVNDIQKIRNAIIFSSLAAIVYSVYHFVIITHNLGYFVLGDSPQVIEALLIDRIYLGILSVISILISLQSIRKTYHPLNSYNLANIAINIAFLVLIASRISFIALLVVLILKQFYGKKNVWRMAIAGLAAIALISSFFIIKNKDHANFENENIPKIVSNFITESQTYELRASVWSCAATVASETNSFWTGLGFETTNDLLVACYDKNISDPGKKERFISERYNTHNQFLDFYLSAGIIGIILFLAFIISAFKMVGKRFFPTAFLLVFMVYLVFENMFHRQIGAYYVGILIILSIVASLEKKSGADQKSVSA